MANTKLLLAQISMEFILLMAITLAFILLWVPAIITTKKSTQATIDNFYVEKVAEDVSNAADNLCILGEGNERELSLIADKELNITSPNPLNTIKKIIVSDGAIYITKDTKCKMNITLSIGKGRKSIILVNENESISVK